MSARQDIHRPAEIEPSSYKHLFNFSHPWGTGPDPAGWNMGLMQAVRTGEPGREPVYGLGGPSGYSVVITGYREVKSPWGKLPFFYKENEAGGCDVCGARFRHGAAFLHEPSGEVVLLGHICAEKLYLEFDREDWTGHRRDMARLVRRGELLEQQAEEKKRRAREREAAIRRTLDQNPGLAEALEAEHEILADLRDKLERWGSLTEPQVELALRLAREAKEAESLPPEIEPPAGRYEIAGKVISTKWQDSDYGGALKMLVEVAEPGGRYRLWGTVPGRLEVQRGDEVRFSATVKPKEAGFGFFSRPAKAENLTMAREAA